MPRRLRTRWLVLAGLSAVLLFFALRHFSGKPAPEPAPLPKPEPAPAVVATYAGSRACEKCHEAEYRAWQGSHHARAERAYEPAAQTPALPAEPVRWIGVEPLEQVLLRTPEGRIQALDLAHDPKLGQWFGIFGSEHRKPGEWGHWTGRGMSWNASCAYCHNTALHKGYQPARDSYETTFAEQGVGCEACHGPMSAHVDSPQQRSRPALQTATCGACHARRAELSDEFVPGEAFDDHFALEIPSANDTFYADGQVRDEAYELTSFLGSQMAHAGVTCSDCHDSHNGKLRASGNALCLSCHATGERGSPRIDASAHSGHRSGGPGDACVDCHMPVTTYMQRHARRDHGFTIPDPRLTVYHRVPNACTRCHDDKPASWAMNAIQQRPGAGSERAARAHARSDLVARGRERDLGAQSGLLALAQGSPIPLWRAVAVGLLEGYLDAPEVLQTLLAAASDPDPLVRSHALRVLELARPEPAVEARLKAALADPVRGVRIAAAWSLRSELVEESSAGRDLLRSLELASDQPTGQMQLGEYFLARERLPQALDHFERAVRWDGASAALRHELAIALSRAGRGAEAVSALREAQRLEPKQAQYSYALGLALNEIRDLAGAIAAFERTVALEPGFARAWYNLALARNQRGDTPGALAALAGAEAAAPGDPDIARARRALLGR